MAFATWVGGGGGGAIQLKTVVFFLLCSMAVSPHRHVLTLTPLPQSKQVYKYVLAHPITLVFLVLFLDKQVTETILVSAFIQHIVRCRRNGDGRTFRTSPLPSTALAAQ